MNLADINLAEKIIKLRKEQGWSQEDLAARLDITRQSVSKWESASSVPDLDKIVKMDPRLRPKLQQLLKAGQTSRYWPGPSDSRTL